MFSQEQISKGVDKVEKKWERIRGGGIIYQGQRSVAVNGRVKTDRQTRTRPISLLANAYGNNGLKASSVLSR